MPTDPFVPPDPSSRPRQQQNLPPGVALPPASGWKPDRPGDLGPKQPHGELLGRPGPNVGYAYTLAERAKDRVRVGPHEHLDDAISVIAEVAGKRAASFGRAPVMPDIDIAIKALGYDGTADNDFVELRTRLVQDAGHSYRRRRVVVDAIPDAPLRTGSLDVAAVRAQFARLADAHA